MSAPRRPDRRGLPSPRVRSHARSRARLPSRVARASALLTLGGLLWLAAGCNTWGGPSGAGRLDLVESGYVPAGAVRAEDLLVVDCLLPGQVRKLGRSQVFMTPRRPVQTSASECEIRGGEYVAYDRADYRTALRVWQEAADRGEAEAQNRVGEIYEKGLGVEPDYALAASWYRKAADQGLARAMLNLGALHEAGRGVEQDTAEAIAWYRRASGLVDAGLQYEIAAPGPRPDERPSGARAEGLADEILLAAMAPPSIQLIEPSMPETRAIQVVYDPPRAAGDAKAPRTLVGRVTAPAGLVGLFVDGIEQDVDGAGLFRSEIRTDGAARELVIAAVDRQGRRAERRLRIGGERSARKAPGGSHAASDRATGRVDFGRFHALVIGNSRYAHLPQLKTARADADAVAATLRDRYGFRVKLLHDATRYDILSVLNELRATLTEEDNLLVYYAGHGELDEVNMRGQWLPVDAERDSTANWISNVAITDVLNAMNARHVMVVSDSCYSGALTRSALASLDAALSDEKRAAWLETLAAKRSRTALTSGGLAPVLDAGGGGHSVFAGALLDVLRSNDEVLEGQRLFQEMSARVTYAARSYQFEQLPQYAPIKFAGHEAGDFFLVPAN
ncbi:MAG: caspase family protein [Spirochaetaceae bacterium]|nr:caspase family protein [Myxococcales bacterium]MCB9723788.1 caspase family protein [Spirochaetaceae bacterium]